MDPTYRDYFSNINCTYTPATDKEVTYTGMSHLFNKTSTYDKKKILKRCFSRFLNNLTYAYHYYP